MSSFLPVCPLLSLTSYTLRNQLLPIPGAAQWPPSCSYENSNHEHPPPKSLWPCWALSCEACSAAFNPQQAVAIKVARSFWVKMVCWTHASHLAQKPTKTTEKSI